MEYDIFTLRVDVQVAVLGAYGAVAVNHFLRVERWGQDFVLDGAAVAVGFAPDFGGGFRFGHWCGG